jgi:peptidoglycan/xylan/chitin deacetylase (PgdA/CDA1 family)
VIRNEVYRTYPTPYVVQRAGALPKTVALTFDDGPDAEWTPKILDVLEREHVPATFFVIGENALQHPSCSAASSQAAASWAITAIPIPIWRRRARARSSWS